MSVYLALSFAAIIFLPSPVGENLVFLLLSYQTLDTIGPVFSHHYDPDLAGLQILPARVESGSCVGYGDRFAVRNEHFPQHRSQAMELATVFV